MHVHVQYVCVCKDVHVRVHARTCVCAYACAYAYAYAYAHTCACDSAILYMCILRSVPHIPFYIARIHRRAWLRDPSFSAQCLDGICMRVFCSHS